MFIITDVFAREILDSRWNPTVEVDVILSWWAMWRAAVPSWASTGENEAVELRDSDKSRYLWKWVLKAIENVNTIIADQVIGLDATDQTLIDKTMIQVDWTKNKSNLWANAILWVSLAVAKAAAEQMGLPLYRYVWWVNAKELPVPMMNILNWGSHADSAVDVQEFMVQPVWAKTFSEWLRMGTEIFHHLGKLLKANWDSTNVWNEWWYAPANIEWTTGALDIIMEAIKQAWYEPGKDIMLAMDAAASEFCEWWEDWNKIYHFKREWWIKRTTKEMVEWYIDLTKKYPIISIEDWLDESDRIGFADLTDKIWDKIQIVWDDLFVTNTEYLSRWIKEKSANSILIKLNQIWTLTETLDAIEMAKEAWYTAVISHRSWETEDNTIADIAVATNAWQIKTWSASRSDRMAKYNQLLRIEEELWTQAKYEWINAFYNIK